jgi:hypothetical protein
MGSFGEGDYAYLKEPYLGYRYVDILEVNGDRLLVRLTSGKEIEVYEDELEE